MSTARLTALRLVGFKSFAEKTVIEFGAGISAVVGPNGSGKSNLADALRWTLGEQGRSLRTRRSEDVIFAGSSARRAIGMADVTLVIDNHDRLLPVDFGEVELGRRLYRSGENEYLLNRQRVRLRDLVELLDAGNLADNAFLFIGQGMVDQALALRPEERRPLFEEAAGVRRHERRRRQAEAELVEAETNLERLRDLLAELRPQAKRLSAQAEQLQARRSAGVELAEALLAAARARWAALSTGTSEEQVELEHARAAADAALAELKAAEGEAAELASLIGKRADSERQQRATLDMQRARLNEMRVEQARLESELTALQRDRQRVSAERAGVDERRRDSAAALAAPVAGGENVAGLELEHVERQLADFGVGLEGATRQGPAALAVELATRRGERDQQTRRLETLEAALAQAQSRLDELAARRAEVDAETARAAKALAAAQSEAGAAQQAADAAQREFEAASQAHAARQSAIGELDVQAATVRARLAGVESALVAGQDDGLAHAARARGAKLVAEGLEVERRFRAAVSAALGPGAAAYLVPEPAIAALAERRGTLIISGDRRRAGYNAAAIGAVVQAALDHRGGRLSEAIRRDPQGHVSRLLERVVWLPDLAAALRMRPALAPGWLAVTLEGEVVTDQGIVQLAGGEAVLDLTAERDEHAVALTALEAQIESAAAALEGDAQRLAAGRETLIATQGLVESGRIGARRAEEADRIGQRRSEQLLRENEWESARVARIRDEFDGVRQLAGRLTTDVTRLETALGGGGVDAEPAADATQEVEQLRARADELRNLISERDSAARATEEARRRAEISASLDAARARDLDAEDLRIYSRDVELTERRAQLDGAIAAAAGAEAQTAAALETDFAAASEERTRLSAAESRQVLARDALREEEARSRQAEVRAMEARLQLESNREQLLVELAGIGQDGLDALAHAAGNGAPANVDEGDAQAMEVLLDRVVERWKQDDSVAEQVSTGRLGTLRRRFHELGAGNPFAVEEYAELGERLESMETQRADIEAAITTTRELIGSLSTLINDQFRSTFAALEDAFARRFHELFGGGDAQLSLTAPDDLSTTGIDIHARPPGKKRQPLQMLSGGERALTAVSLLLAMLEVRPVPFCVLDEVDAALDEANISRFSRALRGLAEQTQFIVITHNRGTIEAADALYGVTIGDDAVSRVVSLRLPGVASGAASASGDDHVADLAETAAT